MCGHNSHILPSASMYVTTKGYPAGPHLPNVIPKTIPNHSSWFMYFIDHKLKYSHSSFGVYSQTGLVFGSTYQPSIITIIAMSFVGGTLQGSNRLLLDQIVPPIALLFALLLIYSLFKCSKSIAWSQCFKKEDHDYNNQQIKYAQLTTMEEDERGLLIEVGRVNAQDN